MPMPKLERDRAALLVVDLQQKLLPLVADADAVQQQCIRMIQGCAALGVPVLATEQYPKGLGQTVEPVARALGEVDVELVEKVRFSACVEPIHRKLTELNRTHVIICGIETHVCVVQTASDIQQQGLVPFVVGDAVGSRRHADRDLALQRMTAGGVVPLSTEMALLEMVHEAGTPAFKAILPLIR